MIRALVVAGLAGLVLSACAGGDFRKSETSFAVAYNTPTSRTMFDDTSRTREVIHRNRITSQSNPLFSTPSVQNEPGPELALIAPREPERAPERPRVSVPQNTAPSAAASAPQPRPQSAPKQENKVAQQPKPVQVEAAPQNEPAGDAVQVETVGEDGPAVIRCTVC